MFSRWLAVVGFGVLTSCAGHGPGGTGSGSNEASGGEAASGSLSELEVESLLFMREEEKLARDVYRSLDGYGNPFVNIQGSEQNHMDALLGLLDAYGLADPVVSDEVGSFANQELKALYVKLVEQGEPSELAALSVGCTIEELDIRDIERAKEDVTHDDVIATYDLLLLGSRNHLRAFYGKLKQRGGSYTPQYIDQTEFDAIVNSSRERPRG